MRDREKVIIDEAMNRTIMLKFILATTKSTVSTSSKPKRKDSVLKGTGSSKSTISTYPFASSTAKEHVNDSDTASQISNASTVIVVRSCILTSYFTGGSERTFYSSVTTNKRI